MIQIIKNLIMGIFYHDDVKKFMYHSRRKSVRDCLKAQWLLVCGGVYLFTSVLNSEVLYILLYHILGK